MGVGMSGSLRPPSIKTGSDHRTLDFTSPGTSTKSPTATGRDQTPDLPNSATRTSDNPQASETPDSTTLPDSIFTTHSVTTTSLPTSVPPAESSSPFSSELISSSSISRTFSTSPGEPPMSASTISETYSAYSSDGRTTVTSSSPNNVFTAYSVIGTALLTLDFSQAPSSDDSALTSSTPTRASSTFLGGPASASITSIKYSAFPSGRTTSTTSAEEGASSTRAQAPATSPRSGFTTSTTAAAATPTPTASPTTTTTPNSTCRPGSGICGGSHQTVHAYVQTSRQSLSYAPPNTH